MYHGTMPGAPRLDNKPFLVFTYPWKEDVVEIYKESGAPCNINLVLAVPWLV